MNISNLRRILKEVLIKSCTTEQMSYIGREADPNFNLRKLSGFGEHLVISKQVAADIILDYFESEYEILNFIATLFYYDGKGISGGHLVLKDKQRLITFLEENDLYYDSSLKKFISKKEIKREDWGILEEGKDYRLGFLHVDIVGSSELIKTNVKIDVENTLRNFHQFLHLIIQEYDGRIWQWEGDGGLIAFLSERGVSGAIRAALQILYQLPVFNLTSNQLRWENQIAVRIAVHYGTALFKKQLENIAGEDIEFVKTLEREMGVPNSIILSETAFNICDRELKKFFQYYIVFRNQTIYQSRWL